MPVNVSGWRSLYSRDPVTGEVFAISSVGPSGATGPAGLDGATGPVGPSGPVGVPGESTVIIGEYGSGSITGPAGLPPDGALVAGAVDPTSSPYQMELGQALLYRNPGDIDDGSLWQWVSPVTIQDGWIDCGVLLGPTGPVGEDGITGPTGPMTDEFHVGNELPTGPAGDQVEMWLDQDDDRILGPTNLPTGGATGNALLKASGLDGDVAWGGDINLAAGDIIRFKNDVTNKIFFYGETFGAGIESGTLTLFGSTNVRFREGGLAGPQMANISEGAFTTTGNIAAGTYFIATGASNTAVSHYYLDSENNTANVYFKVIQARRLDTKDVFIIKGYQGVESGGQPENCHCKIYVNAGDDGVIEVCQAHHSNATGKFHVHGDLTTSGSASLMSAGVRSDQVRPLDPERVGKLIDRLQPVTFRRLRDRAEGATRDPELRRYAGFDSADISDEYREELVDLVDGQDGVSLSGLLAAAIVELKSLRARVKQLEEGA